MHVKSTFSVSQGNNYTFNVSYSNEHSYNFYIAHFASAGYKSFLLTAWTTLMIGAFPSSGDL